MWFKLLIDLVVLDVISLAYLAWEARNAPLLSAGQELPTRAFRRRGASSERRFRAYSISRTT